MTSRSRVHTPFLIGLIFLILGLFPAKSFAQTDGYLTNGNTRGLEAANPFQIGDIDNINLANGALNLRIPAFQRKGRGGRLDSQYFFSYTSKIWSFFPIWDALDPSKVDALDWDISFVIASPVWLPLNNATNPTNGTLLGNETLNYDENSWDCTINNVGYTTTADYNFQYKMPDGSAYRLANLHYDTLPNDGHKCTSLSARDVAYSEMGGIKLDSSIHPYTAQLKDGSRNSNAEAGKFFDTNGNFISVNGGDTLGRTVGYTDQPPLQTWAFTDSNGTTQRVTELLAGGASSTTQFRSTSCYVVPIHQYTGTMGGTNTLTMPDGRAYVLTFDPNFDEVTKVTLPTGGYIRYQYTTLAAFDQSPNLGQCSYPYGMDSRRISARFISPDGNPQHEQEWQYAYANNSAYTTTVTDPLGNVTVHTFNQLGIDQRTHETSTQYYDNAGHLLRTIANTWSYNTRLVASYPYGKYISTRSTGDNVDWQITATTTTLADTNQVKEVDTTYDSFSCGTGCTASLGNVLSQSEYDWGNGTRGSLLRRTVYTYLSDNNSNYANQHIDDRVASMTIYDSSSNTCKGQSQPCAQTTYGYDTTTIAPRSGVVQHDYTDYPSTMTYRGNPTTISLWRNTDGAFLTTTNYYDELGNLKQTTDPLSHSTYFDYTDSWSGTACIPSGGTANAFVTKTTNALSQFATAKYYPCSSLAASTTDPNGQPTSFTYDGVDRLTQQNLPDLGQRTNCYSDMTGGSCYNSSLPLYAVTTIKVTSSVNLIGTSVVDGLGRISQTQLNSDPEPNGTDYTDFTYDALGRVHTRSNPHRAAASSTDGTTTYAYDALGRTTSITLQDGSVTTTSYSGNTTTATDPAGKSRKSVTDGLGRLTQLFEDPAVLKYETDYTYDTLNNLLTVNQKGGSSNSANWRTRTFAYDSLSHLTSSINPESNTEPVSPFTIVPTTYSYDANGNLSTKKAPAPNQASSAFVTTTYTYDALNRLTLRSYSDGTTPAASFNYDLSSDGVWTMSNPVGRLVVAYAPTSSDDASEVFSYDAMGRVILHAQAGALDYGKSGTSSAYNVNYTYDLAGNLTKEAMNGWEFPSSGVTLSYAYNSASQPTSVTSNLVDSQHPSPLATVDPSVGYYPTGALRKILYGNGLTQAISIESRLQPCRINLNSSGAYITDGCADGTVSGTVQDFDYAYGNWGTTNSGNVTTMAAGGAQNFSRTYTYDTLNRLGAMSDSNSGQQCRGLSWTDDAWGNRTDQTNTAGTCPTFHQTVNPQNNRLVGPPYLYDTAGNMIYDGTHRYTYDAENRITQVDSGSTASYVYSVEGRRVTKISGGSTHDYVYDLSDNVIAEMTSSGWQVGNVYLGGQMIAEYKNSTTYFVHQDHLGSTRLVSVYPWVSPSQSLVQNLDYFPYGELNSTNSGITTREFTGKERDGTAQTETGLDNFGARYNSSNLGRFMSPDPGNVGADWRDPQSWNAYSYTGNNPLNRTDPTGLDYGVCVDDGQGGQNCSYYANDKDFQNTMKNPGAGIAFLGDENSGNIYGTDANGNLVQVGTYQHFFGPGAAAAEGLEYEPGTDLLIASPFTGLVGSLFGGASAGATSSVWSLGNFARGNIIEQMLGGNLPRTFPVIDAFEDGVATSIKSIDLTAASYQAPDALASKLTTYVDKLAGFQGGRVGDAVVDGASVTGKVLKIAVPDGSIGAAQQAVINRVAAQAAQQGVKVVVVSVR